MAEDIKRHYTLDRDPDSGDWDECPGCGQGLHYKGEDPHVDEFEIYAYFECRSEGCRARDIVVRYQGNAEGTGGESIVRARRRRGT